MPLASIPTAARSRSATRSAAPAQNLLPPSFANCSAATHATAWSPCALAAAWAPPAFSSASLDRRSDDRPTCKWNLIGGVAPEERIRLPARTRGSVRRLEQQSPRKLLVARGGFKIHGLVHVVARRVVAVGEPVLENFLLRRAKFEADVHFHGGGDPLFVYLLIP